MAIGAGSAGGQMPDDGFLMPARTLTAGVMYSRDQWNEYWEGTRKRDNDNVGTLTTQSATVAAMYGLNDRLSFVGMVPYIWTSASQGTLHGMSGVQDLTLAAKYRLLITPFTGTGTLTALLVGAVGIPIGDYTPDFLPLSIGSRSRRFTGRFNLHFQSAGSWFASSSVGHTWRNTVTLNRDSYYTNGLLYLTNEVDMPSVFDYTVSAGYRAGRLHVPVSFADMRTLGGSDIRRNDMPFVSNRMNVRKFDVAAMYAPPVLRSPMLRVGVSRVLAGRNVGESTTITAGVLYMINLPSR